MIQDTIRHHVKSMRSRMESNHKVKYDRTLRIEFDTFRNRVTPAQTENNYETSPYMSHIVYDICHASHIMRYRHGD